MSLDTNKQNEQTENTAFENEIKNEASRILWLAKKTWNEILISKFEKEYKDLETQINKSIQNNNNITGSKLTRIKLEFSNIISLADKNDLIEWNLTHKAKTIWKDTIREKSQGMFNKVVYSYTKEEAIWTLEYLNDEYSNFKNATFVDKSFAQAMSDNSIDELKTNYEVKLFQEILIKKILWRSAFKKWYNNELLRWFNDEKFWVNKSSFSIFWLILSTFPFTLGTFATIWSIPNSSRNDVNLEMPLHE